MPAWKERLVKKLMKEGHSEDSAWAIATSVEKKKKRKKHRRSRKR